MALFPLGILSAAGAGGAALIPDYDLLETQILGSTEASITFSSLGTYASTYKHLQIRMTARLSGANGIDAYINGDTGSNYAGHLLRGNGSTVTSFARSSSSTLQIADSTSTANVFTGAVVDILDFASSTKNTTIRSFTGDAGGQTFIQIWSGLWNNTAAVTSIEIYGRAATTLQIGSRFSLYGIRG
jgi:hypothetical protein